MSLRIDDTRIRVDRHCKGIYIRWYYNGWHYWLFNAGKYHFVTEGEKFRTLGSQKLSLGSRQVTTAQVTAIRSIQNARELYVLTDFGWRSLRVEHSTVEVFNNMTGGYDVEVIIIVGSRWLSRTGLSPAELIPEIDPSYTFCELSIIGNQIWMCLNYDVATPGSLVYDGDEANRIPRGGLYTHNQVMAAGFCPDGWKVPTIAEWMELINFVGDETDAGGILKETGVVYWDAPNTGAADTYDFGMRSTGAYGFVLGQGTVYHQMGEVAILWAQDGFVRFDYNSGSVTVVPGVMPENYYYGVRLLKISSIPTFTQKNMD